MLHSQASDTSSFIAALDLLSKGEAAATSGFAGVPVHPMIEPSIAESAGLSRFVYVTGNSKTRYVFSSIQQGQISLYCDAVFVVVDKNSEGRIWVGDYTGLLKMINVHGWRAHIYVHLLAEGAAARSDIIADLTNSNIH